MRHRFVLKKLNRALLFTMFSVLVILTLGSCTPAGSPTFVQTSVPLQNNYGQVDPTDSVLSLPHSTPVTIVPFLTQISTPDGAYDPSPKPNDIPPIHYPDITISYGNQLYFCIKKYGDQIIKSSYPYTKADWVLSDEKIDYYFPSWSPDKNFIAYVQSTPSNIQKTDEKIIGTDNIWLIKPDGTDRQKISDSLPSALIYFSANQCDIFSGISSPLYWSRDGSFIAFTYLLYTNDPDFSIIYYVLDLKTGKFIEINRQKKISSPILWTIDKNNLIMFGDEGKIYLFEQNRGNEFTKKEYLFPDGINKEYKFSFVNEEFVNVTDDKVYVIFSHASDLISPKEYAYWQLDMQSAQWSKVAELGESNFLSIVKSDDRIISCRDHHLSILSLEDWKPLQELDSVKVECRQIHSGDYERKLISFISADQKEIWIVPTNYVSSSEKIVISLDTLIGPYQKVDAFITNFNMGQ